VLFVCERGEGFGGGVGVCEGVGEGEASWERL